MDHDNGFDKNGMNEDLEDIPNENRNLKITSIIKRLKKVVDSTSDSMRQLHDHTAIDQFLDEACRKICDITMSSGSLIIVDDAQNGIQSLATYGLAVDILGAFGEIRSSGHYDELAEGQYFNCGAMPSEAKGFGIDALIYYKLEKSHTTTGYIIAVNGIEYLDEEIDILGIFAHQIMMGIDISLTSKKIVKHKMIEQELDIVSQQQKLIMSGNNMCLEGCGEISFIHRASEYVGGDFCKVFKVDEHRVGVFITDVMGHGVLSNYFGAIIKGSLKTLIYQGKSASEILTQINNVLYDDFDRVNIFATARLAIFDGEKNAIVSSNAGHVHPIGVKKKDEKIHTEELDIEKGIPLGVLSDTNYEEYEYRLDEYEMVAFYTDGIIEAEGRQGGVYGVKRLERFLKDNFSLRSNEIYSKFENEIQEFTGRKSQEDDYVLLIYKRSIG